MSVKAFLENLLSKSTSDEDLRSAMVDAVLLSKADTTTDITATMAPVTKPILDQFTKDRVDGEPPPASTIKVGPTQAASGGNAANMMREYARLMPQDNLVEMANKLGDEFGKIDGIVKAQTIAIDAQGEALAKAQEDLRLARKQIAILSVAHDGVAKSVTALKEAPALAAKSAISAFKVGAEEALVKSRTAFEGAKALRDLGMKEAAVPHDAVAKSAFATAQQMVASYLATDSTSAEALMVAKSIAAYGLETGLLVKSDTAMTPEDPGADNQEVFPNQEDTAKAQVTISKSDFDRVMGEVLNGQKMLTGSVTDIWKTLGSQAKTTGGMPRGGLDLMVSKGGAPDITTIDARIDAAEVAKSIDSDTAEHARNAVFYLKNANLGHGSMDVPAAMIAQLPPPARALFSQQAA